MQAPGAFSRASTSCSAARPTKSLPRTGPTTTRPLKQEDGTPRRAHRAIARSFAGADAARGL